MSDTSGRSWLAPLAHYAPDESSLRTWLVTSLWGWTPFSGTLPRWGMTRRGELYELPTPALHMAEPESSSSRPTPRATRGGSATETTYLLHGRNRSGSLLPTPEAKLSDSGPDYARASREGSGGDDLTTTLHRLFPTPSVADAMGGHLTRSGDRSEELLLPGVAKSLTLMPTPRATDGTKGGPNQRGSSGDLMLPSAVLLLPTPTAMDAHGSRGYQPNGEPYTATAGVTLTDAALSSSGAHMPPRLRSGSESLDVLPLDPQNGEAEAESA